MSPKLSWTYVSETLGSRRTRNLLVQLLFSALLIVNPGHKLPTDLRVFWLIYFLPYSVAQFILLCRGGDRLAFERQDWWISWVEFRALIMVGLGGVLVGIGRHELGIVFFSGLVLVGGIYIIEAQEPRPD